MFVPICRYTANYGAAPQTAMGLRAVRLSTAAGLNQTSKIAANGRLNDIAAHVWLI